MAAERTVYDMIRAVLFDMGGTLHSAFWLGAGALIWGLLWMLLVPRRH